jgi:hypothetical protein
MWVSAAVFPTLKQNLTQILCSFSDSVLNMTGEQLLFTNPVLKTKRNIQSTWNKVAYVCKGQDARPLKQRIM